MTKSQRYAVAGGIAVGCYVLYQLSKTNQQLEAINHVGAKVDPLLEKIGQWIGA